MSELRPSWSAIVALLVVGLAGAVSAATTEEIAKMWSPSVVLITLANGKDETVATGTGFVVGPELVATCYHVVAGGASAQVKTNDKITYPVSGVVAHDASRDLAVLKVNKLSGITPIELADSSACRPGQPVVAIGSPLGLEGTVSDGIVSGLREMEEFGPVVQVTAPISPGNSGGPLLDGEGKAIGVVSFYRVGGQNLNFGISSNSLKALLDKRANSPTELKGLKPLAAARTPAVGELPLTTGTWTVNIPKRSPHSIALPILHPFDSATLSVQLGKLAMTRVDDPNAIAKGQYVVTDSGTIVFHQGDKGKKVVVGGKYRVYRTAVYVTGDPSERDLRELLEERLKRVGNQVVVGAEVDVVIGKATLDGLNYLDIARKLNCARLVIASTASNVSDYNQYSFAVDTAMSLTMVDLNSGRTIMKRNTNTGCTVGKLRSWRKARRDNVEFCIASVFGGS